MKYIASELRDKLTNLGVSDVGFAKTPDGAGGLLYSVSIVVALSDAIVDEITDEPTHTYFNHYRTVNTFIDQCLLQAGLYLQDLGYKYITIPASQSINGKGEEYAGRYSHKKAACLAGLGTIGKNDLFLHNRYGSRVRLGTLFTDCPISEESTVPVSLCGSCRLCVDACPASAIIGNEWQIGMPRDELVDARACSEYMKQHFMQIGRGSVCGVCIRVCPRSKGR